MENLVQSNNLDSRWTEIRIMTMAGFGIKHVILPFCYQS